MESKLHRIIRLMMEAFAEAGLEQPESIVISCKVFAEFFGDTQDRVAVDVGFGLLEVRRG
jgi:hypothetical protein